MSAPKTRRRVYLTLTESEWTQLRQLAAEDGQAPTTWASQAVSAAVSQALVSRGVSAWRAVQGAARAAAAARLERAS